LTELSPELGAAGLRLLRAEDASELHALVEANREHLARWLPWAGEQDLPGTERFIVETQGQRARDDGFQACIAPAGPIVGMAGFHSIDWGNRRTSIGYWLSEDHQGRGLMTTAVSALIDHAFGERSLHRLEIHCAPANRRSRAIPERLGFREEATLRETELVGGRPLDSVVYGLLADEWKGRPAAADEGSGG
jgi:ribosomal-protein-serine acetyltransferase